MKKMKKVLMLGIAILMIAGMIKLLDIEKESVINSCINAGYNQAYCEYHAN
jgi:hypothetical protein